MFEIPTPKVIEPDVFVYYKYGSINLRQVENLNWRVDEDSSVLEVLYKSGRTYTIRISHTDLDDFIHNLKTTTMEHNMGYDFASDVEYERDPKEQKEVE